MQILSQDISTALDTGKNCVRKTKVLKIPRVIELYRYSSLPRLVSRAKERHMLAVRDYCAAMALLLPLAKEGNVVLV